MPAKDRLRIVPPTAPSGLKRKEYPESDNPRPSAIRKTKRVRLQAQPVMPTFREALMQRGRKVYIDPACTWWLRKLVVSHHALPSPRPWPILNGADLAGRSRHSKHLAELRCILSRRTRTRGRRS